MPTVITSGAASAKGYGYAARAAADPVYIEDVFSTYLYTGTDAAQTITNGIDLSTKGGLVVLKPRVTGAPTWWDTARGATKYVQSNATSGQTTLAQGVTAFNTTGFSLGDDSVVNGSVSVAGGPYVGWTFRKQAKFFTCLTYTGTGSARTITHDLGSVPGVIIVKRTSTTGNWQMHHRSLTSADYSIQPNLTDAEASATDVWNNTAPTSTVFSVGVDATVNANGGTYVAYLFAHDAGGFGVSGTDSVTACGTYTGNGSATGPTVTLGWEPQLVIIKNRGSTGSWQIIDNMRGMAVTANAPLVANTSAAEGTTQYISPTSTGFQVVSTSSEVNSSSTAYIYIAIRRGPMKVPTDATKVFQPKVYTGTNVDNRLVTTDIVTDMVMVRQRDDTVLGGMAVGDRLRGQSYLLTGSTAAEVDDANSFDKEIVSPTEYGTVFSSMTGFWVGNDATAKLNANTTSNNHVALAFRRAPGVFDCVCYTGTGSATTVTHNLGATPELMVVKRRGATNAWAVYGNADNTDYLVLDTNAATADDNTYWNDTSPTSTAFTVGTNNAVNASGSTYVAYLFASCSGVSKVGSYTGTGTTKQIDCGFTGGARFVLIKRTDSTGDWCVWDSARGVVSGNDPYLLLNSSAAEVTNTDYIDAYSAGFEISSTAPAAINANGGTFIYLAIA